MKYIAELLLYIWVHILAAKLGFFINDAIPGVNTFFWPPAGISVAVLLLFGYRFLPGMFIGAILASLLYGATVPVAISSGIGSTISPFLSVFIAKYFFTFNPSLKRIRDIVGLLFAGIPIGSVVLATLITFGFVKGGLIEASEAFGIWVAIWICNVLSASIVSTIILVWFREWRVHVTTRARFFETVGLFGSLGLLIMFMFTGILGKNINFAYFVFLPLVWAALRFGIREVVTILFLFSATSLWSTFLGKGPTRVLEITTSILYLEGFVSVISVASLVLAVAVAERRDYEQRKDNFISMASHELRTPLTSVKMMTQVLMRMNKRREEKKYLENMDQQLDKLTRLINEMLDLSKIQAHKLNLRKESFSLDNLLEQLAAHMQIMNPSHRILIEGETSVKLNADKDRVEQVLVNLLSNAINYSPKADKVRILVNSDKNYVVIGVQDFGIGIAKDDIEKVFERFFRVNKSHSQGFGLGLYIASEIIKQHEGKIWVDSEPGKGSTFYFTLPLA